MTEAPPNSGFPEYGAQRPSDGLAGARPVPFTPLPESATPPLGDGGRRIAAAIAALVPDTQDRWPLPCALGSAPRTAHRSRALHHARSCRPVAPMARRRPSGSVTVQELTVEMERVGRGRGGGVDNFFGSGYRQFALSYVTPLPWLHAPRRPFRACRAFFERPVAPSWRVAGPAGTRGAAPVPGTSAVATRCASH